jgi:hypothetical protein
VDCREAPIDRPITRSLLRGCHQSSIPSKIDRIIRLLHNPEPFLAPLRVSFSYCGTR